MSSKRLTLLVAMALMVAMMVASAGMAWADPGDGSCAYGAPPGSPSVAASCQADEHALAELTYTIERRGLK